MFAPIPHSFQRLVHSQPPALSLDMLTARAGQSAFEERSASMSAVLSAVDDDFPRDRQVAQLRIPPHSIEAESSVLGGLLLDNNAWDRVGDLLTDGDFYRYEHQLIYGAIGTPDQRQQAGRRHHRLRAAAVAGQGRGDGRPGLPELAGAVRAQRQQHPPLRGDRARALHPAQAGHGQRRDRHRGLQHAGQGGREDPGRGRAEDLQHRRGRLAR